MCDTGTLSAPPPEPPQEACKAYQFDKTNILAFGNFANKKLHKELSALATNPYNEYGDDEKDDKKNRELRGGKDAKPFPKCLNVTDRWENEASLVELVTEMREIPAIKAHGSDVLLIIINRTHSLYKGKNSDDFGWHLDAKDAEMSEFFYLFDLERGECAGIRQGGNLIYWKNGKGSFENSSGFRSRPQRGIPKNVETGTQEGVQG
jgi:hypothetical protein